MGCRRRRKSGEACEFERLGSPCQEQHHAHASVKVELLRSKAERCRGSTVPFLILPPSFCGLPWIVRADVPEVAFGIAATEAAAAVRLVLDVNHDRRAGRLGAG